MTVRLNNVWGVVLRDGSFVLQRKGRDYRVYRSGRELWDNARHLFGKVDDGASTRLLTLKLEGSAGPDDQPIPVKKLGYWLHPEQLPKGKEGNHIGTKHVW